MRAWRPWPYLLLLVFFAMGLAQARQASITFDEGPHLAVGYTTLRTGDFRLQPVHIHPPLANALAAAPLLLQRDLPDPRALEGWESRSLSAITDGVVWQYGAPRRIAFAGRLPILLLGLLLGALVYRWARARGGRRGGLIALALFSFDPNLIAHSALITTDIAAVFFIVVTLYATYRYLIWTSRSTTPRFGAGRLVGIGVCLGLAQLAKVSALMLVPVVGLLLLVAAGLQQRRLGPAIGQAALAGGLVLLAGALTVWAGYGFEVAPVAGSPIPLPAATHIAIYRALREHYDLGHATFALGRVSSHGWAWYFPAAFALKTPLPVLILGLLAAVRWAVRAVRGSAGRAAVGPATLALGLFPLLYAAASIFSTVNIGYRHLLPLLPFLYIALGPAASRAWAGRGRGVRGWLAGAAAGLLGVGLVAGTARTLPYPLTFFNALAGGPDNGYRALVDSNLDWGQNLWDLKAWMADEGVAQVYYAHYSPARPEAYGIDALMLPPSPRAAALTPWRPAPGVYAIGATVLQGPYAPDLNTYAWFRAREPDARLGNALFVYRVQERPAPRWAVICAPQLRDALGGALEPPVLQQQTGLPELRAIYVDCDQAQVYPQGAGPGLYLVPPAVATAAGGDVLLGLRAPDGRTTAELRQVEAEQATAAMQATAVRIAGPLGFLGYRTVAAEDGLLLSTYWRVREGPARPLSLMAHLLAPDGQAVVVADGLGYPREQWQPGDLIVQHHEITPPAGLPPGSYRLVTGGYWLDTMERWATAGTRATAEDAIHLERLEISD